MFMGKVSSGPTKGCAFILTRGTDTSFKSYEICDFQIKDEKKKKKKRIKIYFQWFILTVRCISVPFRYCLIHWIQFKKVLLHLKKRKGKIKWTWWWILNYFVILFGHVYDCFNFNMKNWEFLTQTNHVFWECGFKWEIWGKAHKYITTYTFYSAFIAWYPFT